MIAAIPLTVIPLILFNLLGLSLGTPWEAAIYTVPMVYAEWSVTPADLMIVLGLVMLFFELLRAARPAPTTIANHLVSTVVFIAYLLEFILIKQAAHSVFFILTVIALFDVAAGFSISIRTARRDIALGGFNGNA